MTNFDPVFLSRIQFAWVIGWHILLPAFTLGCAAFIAVLEALKLATGRDVYERTSIFWTKIFSIAFDARRNDRRRRHPGEKGMTIPASRPVASFSASNTAMKDAHPTVKAGRRSSVVRTQTRAALGTFRCRADGCVGYALLILLDSGGQ